MLARGYYIQPVLGKARSTGRDDHHHAPTLLRLTCRYASTIVWVERTASRISAFC